MACAGGKFQRGNGRWDGEPDRQGNTKHDMEGGNCYRRGDDTAEFKCKPSFRYKFDKHNPYNAVFDTLFRFPEDKQRCNDPRKFILNGNWNDVAHIRSKITQDLVKASGGVAPRIEYARLSVNGRFFGLYSIEESLSEHWGNCFGIDMGAEAEEGSCESDGGGLHDPSKCLEGGEFDDECD
jgi:hypothetical protein